jgi:pimeloyl-ACP methyl ester carboxylesterase
VIRKLARALPRIETLELRDAGHVPHATYPEEYVETILAFTRRHGA